MSRENRKRSGYVPWSGVFDTLYTLSMLASFVFPLVHFHQQDSLFPLPHLRFLRVAGCEVQEAYSLGVPVHSSSLRAKEQNDV